MLDKKTKSRTVAKEKQLHKDAIQSNLIDKPKDYSTKMIDTTKTK